MFKSPGRIVYRVLDIEKAKQWYRQVLDADPVFDSPFAVAFPAGASTLVLVPGTGASKGEDRAVVYWAVDDAVASCRRLCELGATPHTDMATMSGMRWATTARGS